MGLFIFLGPRVDQNQCMVIHRSWSLSMSPGVWALHKTRGTYLINRITLWCYFREISDVVSNLFTIVACMTPLWLAAVKHWRLTMQLSWISCQSYQIGSLCDTSEVNWAQLIGVVQVICSQKIFQVHYACLNLSVWLTVRIGSFRQI